MKTKKHEKMKRIFKIVGLVTLMAIATNTSAFAAEAEVQKKRNLRSRN